MKRILKYGAACLLAVTVAGYFAGTVLNNLVPAIMKKDWLSLWDPALMLKPSTWLYGAVVTVMLYMLYLVFRVDTVKRAKRVLKSREDSVESSLENSRFMTDKERDANFAPRRFTKLNEVKKDGIPVYAVYNKKKKELDINLASPMHGLVIGATGSGKTTTFINPMIQILGNSSAGSSMICTDPKGELFQLHSGMLTERGYKVMVLDLRDPYSSFRWNPLGDLYDRYQLYLKAGEGIFECDSSVTESGLELVNKAEEYGEIWYEFRGKAYAHRRAADRREGTEAEDIR